MEYLIYSLEDDKDISHIINATLSKQGYKVMSYFTAHDFFEGFEEKKPDMILLDMMLPDMHGSEILRKIRSDISNDIIPVIIISANNLAIDKVDGLDLGADDYIGKPFDLLELMSRVNVHVRKKNKHKSLKFKNIRLDFDAYQCSLDDVEVNLTNKEFEVIKLLASNPNKVFTREDILNSIWGVEYLETRTVDMHITSIRKKLGEDLIKTVYGVGYKVSI